MEKRILRLSLSSLVMFVSVFSLAAQSSPSPRPLGKSELLALVAGEVLTENIVSDIGLNGLEFTPDASYRSLLKTAGADPKVLAAMDAAKVVSGGKPESPAYAVLLRHLSRAGNMIRASHFDEAAAELTASLAPDMGTEKPAIGFVMGMVLIGQQRWEQAGQVYEEILRLDPGFQEVHSRLTLTCLNSGDPAEALRQAKAALAQNPNNATAHLNGGLALGQLGNLDAAKSEILQAIRCKPDYELAYYDLGILLHDQRDFDGAIAQYKKALALKPEDVQARYNLGVVYGDKGDFVSAIREYREVKRRDPHKLDARQNLGAALMHNDPAAAITEFRELAALAPDFPLCHVCLGSAYSRTGRYPEAEKELRLAMELDPASPDPHIGLGRVLETEGKYDEALREYREAQRLDDSNGVPFADAGRILLLKKDFPAAIAELNRAEQLDPTSWTSHDLRGRALEASGDLASAIAEYQEALSLAPKEIEARLHLAMALEHKGDWPAALDTYRRAAIDEPAPKVGVPEVRFDAENKYQSAQERFQQHLADLRAAGKAPEATALEARLGAVNSTANLDERFHAAMQVSSKAIAEKRFNDAENSAKEAVSIAEQIRPQDGRLPEAVGQLGNVYAWRMDFKNAEDAYKHQLTLVEKLYGPQSPMVTGALQNLAMTALAQKDFAGAAALFSRAVDLNQKTYGEDSTAAADSLRGLAHVYAMQRDFANSESTLLRVVRIYETMYGPADNRLSIPLTSLCQVYDQWDKPDKSEPCHARLVALVEAQFGANSPYLVRDLTAEAQALRKLGRDDEAAKLERRTQSIQSAQPNP
jgi:tetratricopeptide (TPR) repeat protein